MLALQTLKGLFLDKLNTLKYLLILLALLAISGNLLAQEQAVEERQINIVYGANFTKDEEQFPGASLFSKDNRQVQFEHEGANLWCDIAIFYQKENRLKAIGNIRLEQGDSIQLTSGKIDFDGNKKLAKAGEKVLLKNADMTLRRIGP